MSYTTGLTPNSLPLNNDQTGSISSTARTQASSQSVSSSSTAAAEISTDSAKLSLAGAMLSQATTGSDVRFEKVAALRQAIEAGSYNIPASDVASKLVDTLTR